jgi:hypothetical protein
VWRFAHMLDREQDRVSMGSVPRTSSSDRSILHDEPANHSDILRSRRTTELGPVACKICIVLFREYQSAKVLARAAILIAI